MNAIFKHDPKAAPPDDRRSSSASWFLD